MIKLLTLLAIVRTAIYARVSTTANQSVEMQLRDLREMAARRGFEIVGEYCDEGVSGAKNSRPALDKMLADGRDGRFDAIFVWKLDRLGRSLLRDCIRERVRAGMGNAKAKGRCIGRPPLTDLTAEAKSAIARAYLGGKRSLRGIGIRISNFGGHRSTLRESLPKSARRMNQQHQEPSPASSLSQRCGLVQGRNNLWSVTRYCD